MFTFSHLSPLFRRLRHSHEIYADEMERVGRGLALWNPQPVNRPQDSAHSDPPVAIGDVGYCRDGKWHHLFNIHREAGEQRGSPHLPDGFECVPLQDRDLETEYRGPQQFSSASSSSFSVGVGGEHSLLNVQGPSCHISFQSSSSLVYFGQSTHLSTPRVDLYTAYAVRHLSNWENLTRRLQNDGYRLTVKELLLVYECTLAPIWITSTALSRTVDAHLGATVQAVPVGGSVSLAVSFTNTGRGTDYMYGPYSRFNASLYPPTPIEPTLATLDHIAYPADQCLFVKGVHINRLSASDKRKHRRRDGKSRPGEDGYVSGERKSETKDGQLGGGRLRNPSQAEASDGEENRSPRTEDLDRSHEYTSESESEDSNWASDDTNLSLLHDENYLPGVSNEKQATDARTRILEYLLDSNYSKADVAVVRDHDLQPYLEYIEDGVDLSNVLTQALPRVFEYPTTAGLLGSLSELDFEEFQPRSSVEKAALAKTLSEDNVSRNSMDNTESTSKAESSPTRKGFTPSGLSQNMRDKVKQTLERISRRLTKRAYRLDVDLYQAQAWTPYLLQGRYSTPQVYTRWPFDGRAALDPEVETLQTVSIAEDELTSLASTLSVSSLGDRISLEQPAVDELLAEDRAPYTPFNRRHTYPLVSRGKEVATLTILSRAHRAEARPLLCDGDYITGLVTIPGDEISRIRGIEVVFRKFNPGQTTPASEIRSNMTPQDILKDSKSASFKDGVFDWTFELSTLSSITIAQSAELSKSSRPLSPQAAPHWDGYCELSVIVTRRPRLNRNVAFTKVIKFIPPLTTPPPSPTHREFGLARRQSSLWEEQRSTLVSLKGVFFGNNVEFDCAVVTPVTFPARLRSAIPLKLQLSSTNAYAIQTLTRSPSAILDVRLFKVIAHGSEPMSDLIKGVSIWKPRSFHQTKELGSVVWQANDGIALGSPIITRSRVNDRHTVQLQGDFHIIRGLEHEIQRSVQFRDFAVMFIVVLFPLKMGDGFEPANGMPHGKELVLSQIEIQANA